MDYRVIATYDTETTTIGSDVNAHAFVYVYIINDLRNVSLQNYEPEVDDDIRLYRTVDEMLEYIADCISFGKSNSFVPIIAAYNLMYDLQTLRAALAKEYDCLVSAQNSTHVYTFDLVDDSGNTVLRFWDTFFLEMSGLSAMGTTAGLPKAVGDLDYSLVRTPETPLTEREMHYIRRDVQVIPAYLRWMLDAYSWMDASMLGCVVLTKTSIVRQMSKHLIYHKRPSGNKQKLGDLFMNLCQQNLPHDFDTMCLRTACFRGGLTFTAANYAFDVLTNVCSLDVTSMHHAYINGRRVPVNFRATSRQNLEYAVRHVINTPLSDVLKYYENPFRFSFHVQIGFRGLRLRKESAFESYGIACLAEGKFTDKRIASELESLTAIAVDNATRDNGYYDSASGATFAFGKLYSAECACVNLSEIELWNTAQVYEWDSYEIIRGEYTTQTVLPPDYVTLQSNMLFEQKSDVKHVLRVYHEGDPYPGEIPESIPSNIAQGLSEGTVSMNFLKSYYNVGTKGPFNGIYGSQAMQLWRPGFCVDENGKITIDADTVASEENFEELEPEKPLVMYTYGLRIVAGSRMHLIIAIMLIYETFGSRVIVSGGDTDSLKVSLPKDVTPQDIIDCLAPLHAACRKSIDLCMTRIRKSHPTLSSGLANVGIFDIEPVNNAGDKYTYDYHIEYWNKARVSCVDDEVHVTFAGVSRPKSPEGFEGPYNIEECIKYFMQRGKTFAEACALCLGFNTTLDNSVAHQLMRSQPSTLDVVDDYITDYLGNTMHVRAPEAIALYPISKTIGDLAKFSNEASVQYMEKIDKTIDTRDKYVEVVGGKVRVTIGNFVKEVVE